MTNGWHKSKKKAADKVVPVDEAWMRRNIGFDQIERQAPTNTYSFAKAAAPDSEPDDQQREIIDFDSEGPEGKEFFAFSKATGLSRFTDIPWPKNLEPRTGSKPKGGSGPLPKADVLIVTWTVDEGHALSRVITSGVDSRDDYVSYTHNFAAISKKMRHGAPALIAKRLGAFWTTTIGTKTVVVFKSDSHLSQDVKEVPAGNGTLPNYDVWKQIIEEVQPNLVLSTGTGGGIGEQFEVGDVIVSPIVRFDGTHWLGPATYHNAIYHGAVPKTKFFAKAKTLFKPNSDRLPQDNTRLPRIVISKTPSTSVVTTDFFGFDTSKNSYRLQGLGDISEMGDAMLGLVASQTSSPPRWLAVRNVSDPQIKSVGTLKQQASQAAQIYKAFGRWSTVCSAIVCWALIAAEP